MNDEQHVEAARALAVKVMQHSSSIDRRIDMLFRTVLSRYPDEFEHAELVRALTEFQLRYAAAPEAAQQLISVGESHSPQTLQASELAAHTLLANLVLNLDEAITRN